MTSSVFGAFTGFLFLEISFLLEPFKDTRGPPELFQAVRAVLWNGPGVGEQLTKS